MTNDDVSIAVEDVPTDDICTMAMSQPPSDIQASQTPVSQTSSPIFAQDLSHQFSTNSRGRQ